MRISRVSLFAVAILVFLFTLPTTVQAIIVDANNNEIGPNDSVFPEKDPLPPAKPEISDERDPNEGCEEHGSTVSKMDSCPPPNPETPNTPPQLPPLNFPPFVPPLPPFTPPNFPPPPLPPPPKTPPPPPKSDPNDWADRTKGGKTGGGSVGRGGGSGNSSGGGSSYTGTGNTGNTGETGNSEGAEGPKGDKGESMDGDKSDRNRNLSRKSKSNSSSRSRNRGSGGGASGSGASGKVGKMNSDGVTGASKTVLDAAIRSIKNTDTNLKSLGYGNVGCGYAASIMLQRAGYDFPSQPYTPDFKTQMDGMTGGSNPKFKLVPGGLNAAQPGDVVVTPTDPRKGGGTGHVGIAAKDGRIISNSSKAKNVEAHHTKATWRSQIESRGRGLPTYIYRPL